MTDYAEITLSAFWLYSATFDEKYLKFAIKNVPIISQLFSSDFGPFFDTAIDSEMLIKRTFDAYDGVEPSGNSTIVYIHLLLAHLGIEKYREQAEKIIQYFSKDLENYPMNFPAMISSLFLMKNFKMIILISENKIDSSLFINKIREHWLFKSYILNVDHSSLSQLADSIPVLQNKKMISNPTIYICENESCSKPILSLDELEELLQL